MYHESQLVIHQKCSERASCACVVVNYRLGFVVQPQVCSAPCGFYLIAGHAVPVVLF